MIVMSSTNHCNLYSKSFRRLHEVIVIFSPNHCNDFFKQCKSRGKLIEFNILSNSFRIKNHCSICHFDMMIKLIYFKYFPYQQYWIFNSNVCLFRMIVPFSERNFTFVIKIKSYFKALEIWWYRTVWLFIFIASFYAYFIEYVDNQPAWLQQL